MAEGKGSGIVKEIDGEEWKVTGTQREEWRRKKVRRWCCVSILVLPRVFSLALKLAFKLALVFAHCSSHSAGLKE